MNRSLVLPLALLFPLTLLPAGCSKATGPARGDLTVIVLDEGEDALAGATVTLDPEGAGNGEPTSKTSGADGMALFKGIEVGDHVVQVEATNFLPYQASVTIRTGETTTHTATLSHERGSLRIRLAESYTGMVWSDIQVAVMSTSSSDTLGSGTTGADGRVTIAALPAGEVVVRVEDLSGLDLQCSDVHTTVLANSTTDVDVALTRLKSWLLGNVSFQGGGTRYVALYQAPNEGGPYTIIGTPWATSGSYELTTNVNAWLSSTVFGNDPFAEFYYASSRDYDATGGHLYANVPAFNLSIASPMPTNDDSIHVTQLPITLSVDYPETGAQGEIWFVSYWWWDAQASDWQHELVWWSGESDLNEQTSWDGSSTEGQWTGSNPFADGDGEDYTWELVVVYNDGRYSWTDYQFFRLYSSAPARMIAQPPEYLAKKRSRTELPFEKRKRLQIPPS